MSKQETKKRERERTPSNRTTTGFRISDELWAQLQPLLPVHVNTVMATSHIRSKICNFVFLAYQYSCPMNWMKEEAVRFFDATRAKLDPNLRSLSQIRYFGACPYGVASRSCCATQGSVGYLVTPTWITRRVLSSIMKKAKSGRKKRSVTCKKSQAQISAA